jgi:hypothetical protein
MKNKKEEKERKMNEWKLKWENESWNEKKWDWLYDVLRFEFQIQIRIRVGTLLWSSSNKSHQQ